MIYFREEKVIPIPKGCEVSLENKVFKFKGPLGEQSYDASKFLYIFEKNPSEIVIRSWHGNKKKHQVLGTISSHIRNHMVGVTKGYQYVAKAINRHFAINISTENNGKKIIVRNFLGTKDVLSFNVRGESEACNGPTKDVLIVKGINIEDVSQTIAQITTTCNRRKKHDVRIFLDGIHVVSKENMVKE